MSRTQFSPSLTQPSLIMGLVSTAVATSPVQAACSPIGIRHDDAYAALAQRSSRFVRQREQGRTETLATIFRQNGEHIHIPGRQSEALQLLERNKHSRPVGANGVWCIEDLVANQTTSWLVLMLNDDHVSI